MGKKLIREIALVILCIFSSNLITFAKEKNDIVIEDSTNLSDEIILEIENPSQNHDLTGEFFIKGYSVAKNGIENVTVSIDGGKEIKLDYGQERKDIEKKYPTYKNSLKSGYTKTISGLKNGKHELKIKATTLDKKSIEKKVIIQVNTNLTSNMGNGKATKNQMRELLYQNHKGIYSKKQLDEFVEYTIKEANLEGVNHDIAFSLMMVETGYLNFGNDVKPNQNNFGGLGATGNGNPGESFATMQIGIRAVVQHLKAYASDKALNQGCVDNRFQYVKRNSAKYVEHLGIKENPLGLGWAAGKDYGKKIKNIRDKVYTFKAKPESMVESFNVTGKYDIGETINISAKGNPADSTLYKIMIKEAGSWKTVSDYSTRSSISYKIAKPGIFAVQVLVKNKDSINNYDDGKSTANYNIKASESKIETFKVTGKYELGETINIDCKATPSAESLYKIMIKENGSWKTISDYSTKSNASYKIVKPGMFAVQVLVKNKNSINKYDDGKSTSNYNIKASESKIETFKVTGKYELGETINIDCKATPSAESLYKIMIKENGSWKTISDYSIKSNVSYKIAKTGVFAVQILVKNKNSVNKYDDGKSTSNYTINPTKAKLESFSFDGEKKVGSKLTINSKAINHENALYKIMIKEDGNWKTISDYSNKNKAEYVVKKPGTYAAQVLVKDKTSKNSYDDGKSSTNITMKTDVKIGKTTVSGTFKEGQSVKIKSIAEPSNLAVYKIMVKENGTWKTISDYSTKNEINYKFAKPGKYAFQVLVKSKNNTLADYEDYWSSSYFEVKENKKKILIDAGHGSGNKSFDNGDKGSQAKHGSKTYVESELNIQIASKLKVALEKKGYEVLMTRNKMSDDMLLKKRASFGNLDDVDLVISIHQNSYSSSSAHGVEVLVDESKMDEEYRKEVLNNGLKDPTLTYEKKKKESKKIAQSVVNDISKQTGFYNRGVKNQRLTVLRNSKAPAILIECGFISNKLQATQLANSKVQQTIVDSIAKSISSELR